MIGAGLIAKAGELLGGIWAKVLVIGAIVGAVLLTILKLMAAGRAQERAKTQERIIKDVEERHEVDRTVAREPDPAGKLRDKWSRD